MASSASSDTDTESRPEPPPGPQRSTPGSRRRWLVFIAAIAVGVAGMLAFLLLRGGGDDDDPAPSAQSRVPPPVAAKLDPQAQDLLDRLESGRDLTYHATYLASGDPAVIGTELVVQVWREDGKLRQDTRQVTDAGTVETAGIVEGKNETILCQRMDAAEWSCSRQTDGEESPADGLFGSIADQLKGSDVVVTEEEVAGRPARCFAMQTPEGEVSECISEDGIPLRLRSPGSELLLSELSTDVPDDVFKPPAEPAKG